NDNQQPTFSTAPPCRLPLSDGLNIPVLLYIMFKLACLGRRLHANEAYEGLVCAFAEKNGFNGPQDDHQIHQNRHVFYIKKIIIQLFNGVFHSSTVPVIDLCPSGETGFYRKTLSV